VSGDHAAAAATFAVGPSIVAVIIEVSSQSAHASS